MGKKMKLAPVYFTIVQARFNPILILDSCAPLIQELLGKQKYPDVKKGINVTFNFPPQVSEEEGPAQLPVSQRRRYTFCNMERTSGFILDEDALTFQTTAYETFERFSDEFIKGLEAVHEVARLAYTERVGLRYLDAVFPKDGEKLSDYLVEPVLGLTEKLSGNLVHSFTETLVRKDEISVLARTIIQNGRVGLPPDLLETRLGLDGRFRNLQGLHAILDTDGFTERRETIDIQRVLNRLNDIHEEITKAFRATVTDMALNAWE